MEALAVWQVLKRRAFLLALAAVLGAAGAYASTQRAPKIYGSNLTMVLTDRATGRPVSPLLAETAQGYFRSYKTLAISPGALTAVYAQAPYLLYDVGAEGVAGTIFLRMSVASDTPEHARALAQAYATTFPRFVSTFQNGSETGGTGLAVLQAPSFSSSPILPRVRRDTARGGALGLVAGLVVAGLLEGLDRRVRSPRDLAVATGWRVIGVVPRQHRRDRVVARKHPDSGRAEAVRQVRADVLLQLASRHRAVVVVCSAIRGEGRTSTAADLALSLDDAGVRVLLVDADLRRPRVAGLFAAPAAPGLAEALEHQLPLASVRTVTSSLGLHVVPAGRGDTAPAALLAGAGELLRTASADYDVVLVDVPPVLEYPDAAALLLHADAALVVTRLGSTTRGEVAQLAAQLRDTGVEVLGAVANAAPSGADPERVAERVPVLR